MPYSLESTPVSVRTYHQLCGVAKALDLVGQRWTLLIIRDLLAGPLNYSGLLRGLPGLTTNLLAKRLKELSDAGLIEKGSATPGDRTQGEYRLTEAGLALGPVISELANWGRHHGPPAQPGDGMNLRLAMLALSRQYLQTGGRWIVQLDVKDTALQLRLGGPEFDATLGKAMRPDLILRAAPAEFFELFARYADPVQQLKEKKLTLHPGPAGEDIQPIWEDFLSSFGLSATGEAP